MHLHDRQVHLLVFIYIYIYIFLPQCVGGSKEKQDNMVVIPWVIAKLLPSRQIVHSTQQAVYLAHPNMHTNHVLVYSGCHYCKQVLNNHVIVCTFKWKLLCNKQQNWKW